MNESDPFNMISGTTGLTGAVDGSFVLIKDKRDTNIAKLYATGRDIEYKELSLEFDRERYVWRLIRRDDNNDDNSSPSAYESEAIDKIGQIFVNGILSSEEVRSQFYAQISNDKEVINKLWMVVVEKFTIMPDGGLVIRFKKGTGVKDKPKKI